MGCLVVHMMSCDDGVASGMHSVAMMGSSPFDDVSMGDHEHILGTSYPDQGLPCADDEDNLVEGGQKMHSCVGRFDQVGIKCLRVMIVAGKGS